MVICSSQSGGFKPVGMYARQARKPLSKDLPKGANGTSWE